MLDAVALVGLLADPARRRVVAAMVLDEDDVSAIAARSGLSVPAVASAVARLEASGLVLRSDDGRLHLVGEAFAVAARDAASRRDRALEHDGPDAKVLNAFVRDGRILSIPTVHSKRLVLLDMLAQEFEPGRRYSEKMVNLMLGKWHADTATWRRYLVDEGFLDRETGEYWRSGGTVRR